MNFASGNSSTSLVTRLGTSRESGGGTDAAAMGLVEALSSVAAAGADAFVDFFSAANFSNRPWKRRMSKAVTRK